MLCFTHLSSTVGDLMPAKELCRLARERGVLTLVDGAQSFGLLDVNLADMQPDFYSGSAHKWPCGARECGVLFVNKTAQARLWPSIYSAYPGAVGFSRTFEGFGQRDEATMIAFRAALAFQEKVGRAAIEQRARELTTQLMAGLSKLPGVNDVDVTGAGTARPRSCRSCRARSTPTSSRRRSTRRTGSRSRRAAARTAPACASRRISTTARRKSIGCWRR